MKAYYYTGDGDQRLPHEGDPVSLEHLSELGVTYHHFPYPLALPSVNFLASSRSYNHRDEITINREAMGEIYEDKVRMFFNEHLHEDEEIRYILDGHGFFDVRDAKDEEEKWVRIAMEQGDLIILPAGIYHRFTTDMNDHIKAMRLFKDEPKWTPLNRGPDADAKQARTDYLKSIGEN